MIISMKWVKKLAIPSFLVILLMLPLTGTLASVQDEIARRNQEIEEIQRQIDQLQIQIDGLGGKSRTLENEISKLNSKIKQFELEIRSLNLSINQTTGEILTTQQQIEEAQSEIDLHKETLSSLILILYQSDQQNLTEVFLKNGQLSDFFNELANINNTQENISSVVDEIKIMKAGLEGKEVDLADKKNSLEKLKSFQEIERRSVDQVKKDRAKILAQTKGQESNYQKIVVQKKRDIEAIRAQIGFLLQNGLSAEEVVRFGQLAAVGAGIRPAFLLAEAEQESALGANVGRCKIADKYSGKTIRVTNGQVYLKGIHPTRDLPLFVKITAELGLDAFQQPISCGDQWGGAMGLAQFIPSTWMGYRDRVAGITGHRLPNPWNIEDAFVAAAIKLANDGASSKTRAGEIAASKRYYCGSAISTKPSCVNYANSVQNKAAIIEQNL